MALPPKPGEDFGSDGEMENDKELVLTDYDKTRKVVPLVKGRSIIMNTKILSTELTCPICLDILTNTMTTKECLHRFCSDCISMALLRGNKECPTCRTKLVSKRSLRHDTNFDELIKRICPDRQKYESMLNEANKDGDDALSSVVVYADALDEDKPGPPPADSYDPFDKDAPTPPALLDSRRTTSPMEMYDEGRKTPPWFHAGDLDPKLMGPYEKKLYMQAQKAYLKLKNSRLGANLAGLDRIFDGEATETYSKTSRETNSPASNEKQRKLSNGAPKKALADTATDDARDSTDDSIDSDESDTEGVRMEADLDYGHMEELEMMDPRTFLIQTSKEVPKKEKANDVKDITALPRTSVITAIDGQVTSTAMPFVPTADADDDLLFDPRENADPPYPDVVEQFAELMPNGKGGTWQQAVDNPEQPQDDDLDEELVFDEDDVLSVVSIDDLLHEMGMVAHEEDVEALYTETKPEGVLSDLSLRDPNEDKDKYMCDETRMHIREINELRAGCLGDIKATLEDTEQFDLGEATTWYSQTKNGEEMVYYEKSKQPLTRGRRRTTAVYDVAEEVERLGRKVTLKEIMDDMSNTDTDQGTPCTLSLASSPESSKLSLSDIVEEESVPSAKEEAQSPSVDLPPLNPGQVKERLHRWIGDVTPNTPEQLDTPLDRSIADDEDEEDCESLPDNYEIEAELRPSAALLSRNVPPDVLITRFIRTQHNTTIEHLGEFLFQRWLEDVHMKTRGDEIAPDVPRPEHFFVFNRVDRNCKCVLSHEPLVTAQTLTARDDHVVIYFDTQRAEINSSEQSLLEKIVPQKDRGDGTPAGSSRESPGSSISA